MANPTAEAIQKIRARVSDWASSDEAIRNALNAADQPNPAIQGTVPKPMSLTAMMGKVSKLGRGKLGGRATLSQAVLDIRDGDRAAVKNWLQLFNDAGDLTTEELAVLAQEVDAMIPDPDWPPLVSWAVLNLGRPVDTDDIRKARR